MIKDLIISDGEYKFKLLKLKKNNGVGYARQFGLKVSKYEYLFYLDADVVINNKDTLITLFFSLAANVTLSILKKNFFIFVNL